MKKAISLFSIALALSSLAGCGSADSRQAKSPPAYRRGPAVQTVAGVREEAADHDADGILDAVDKEPDAPKPMPSPQLAAPAVPPPAGGQAAPAPAPAPDAAKAAASEVRDDRSLVIYTANVTMAVYQVEQGILAVEKIGKDSGGFLAQKGDRAITIRVPRARFEITLAAIDKVGDVVHRDIQAHDVTDEFVDLEIRIKNARAMRTRLQTLLERANVKEALEIEKELHRVTEELELLEGKIKLLKDKIAYSTITVTFAPRGSALQASKIRLPFPWLSQLGLPSLLTLSEDK